MKRRDPATAEPPRKRAASLDRLIDAMLALRTPAELEAIADRWRVVPLLRQGVAYREIHERTGVSVTTVGRVARCLELGAGGYRIAAERVLGRAGVHARSSAKH
jgi:TrpR-related protein YerC/YecD